jgi:signal transduction histidine kinase
MGENRAEMQSRQRASVEGLSIRAAVFLGFGLIFGLWLFASVQLSVKISESEDRVAAINARYMDAQERLTNIRTQVLMASVAFRDALLDRNPQNIEPYRQQLEQTFSVLHDLLQGYVPADSQAEREQFNRLREEVNAFRGTMMDVLASDRSRWLAEARSLLSQRVTPRRNVVIAVSEGVQSLNRSSYVQRQAEITENYRAMQRELWQLLGLGLAAGLAIAILAIAYAGRLEKRLRRQMGKRVELTKDLQDLSAKLVSAQEEERRHIARELHDEIGQALTAIKVELAYAERSIEEKTGAAGLLRDARSITDGALHQVRDLSYLLHPAALDEFGLVAAIDSYMKTFSRRHNVATTLSQSGMDIRLAPEIEAAAYRVIQEALNNAARHANAVSCQVHLERVDGRLRIAIEDDGVGFDPDEVRSRARKGLGLIGIRERAMHLKGTVVFDSDPGRGTRVLVELPARVRVEHSGFELVSDKATA